MRKFLVCFSIFLYAGNSWGLSEAEIRSILEGRHFERIENLLTSISEDDAKANLSLFEDFITDTSKNKELRKKAISLLTRTLEAGELANSLFNLLAHRNLEKELKETLLGEIIGLQDESGHPLSITRNQQILDILQDPVLTHEGEVYCLVERFDWGPSQKEAWSLWDKKLIAVLQSGESPLDLIHSVGIFISPTFEEHDFDPALGEALLKFWKDIKTTFPVNPKNSAAIANIDFIFSALSEFGTTNKKFLALFLPEILEATHTDILSETAFEFLAELKVDEATHAQLLRDLEERFLNEKELSQKIKFYIQLRSYDLPTAKKYHDKLFKEIHHALDLHESILEMDLAFLSAIKKLNVEASEFTPELMRLGNNFLERIRQAEKMPSPAHLKFIALMSTLYEIQKYTQSTDIKVEIVYFFIDVFVSFKDLKISLGPEFTEEVLSYTLSRFSLLNVKFDQKVSKIIAQALLVISLNESSLELKVYCFENILKLGPEQHAIAGILLKFLKASLGLPPGSAEIIHELELELEKVKRGEKPTLSAASLRHYLIGRSSLLSPDLAKTQKNCVKLLLRLLKN